MSITMLDDEALFVKKDPAAWIALLSAAAYIFSFTLPAANVSGQTFFRFQAFAVAFACMHPAWLGNPAYWLALFLPSRNPAAAACFAFFAWIFSLSVLAEGAGSSELKIGYFLWCGSFLLFALGACIAAIREAKS